MATRLYLPAANQVGAAVAGPVQEVSVTPDASWEATASAVLRTMHTLKSGSTVLTTSIATILNSPAGAVDIMAGQFVSRPLSGSGTISGNIGGQIRCTESNATADMRIQWVLRVVSNDGTSVVGTLFATDTAALSHEFNTAARNITFPRGGAAAPSSVAYTAGDRLVLEIGYRKHENAVTSRTGSLAFGDPIGSSDLPVDETTTTGTAWIEFADTLTFQSERPRVDSASLIQSAAATPVTSIVIPVPEYAAGDVLIMTLHRRTQSAISTPSGWTLITPTGFSIFQCWRAASSEPSDYTPTWTTGTAATGSIASFSGVSTTDPILAFRHFVPTGTGSTIDVPKLHFNSMTSLILEACMYGVNAANTPPSGYSRLTWGNPNAGGSDNLNATTAVLPFVSTADTSSGLTHTNGAGSARQITMIALRPSGLSPLALRGYSVNLDTGGSTFQAGISGGNVSAVEEPQFYVAGDTLVAIVVWRGTATLVSTPTGFVQKGSTQASVVSGPVTRSIAIFEKASASGPGADSLTWVFSGAPNEAGIHVLAFTGPPADLTIPAIAGTVDTTSGGTLDMPAVTIQDYTSDIFLIAAQLTDRGDSNGVPSAYPSGYDFKQQVATTTAGNTDHSWSIRRESGASAPSGSWTLPISTTGASYQFAFGYPASFGSGRSYAFIMG